MQRISNYLPSVIPIRTILVFSGESLVSETIRQIMAARALHNVFKTTDSNLVVSSQCMRLVDPSNNSTRVAFMLEDIAFWASHKENKR